jgi:hypothetical protein
MNFWQVIGKYIADSWEMLIGRSGGPFALRFILQPVMATIFAVRAGPSRCHAPAARPTCGRLSKRTSSTNRRRLLRDGWKDIGKIFTIAIILDVSTRWPNFTGSTHPGLDHCVRAGACSLSRLPEPHESHRIVHEHVHQ